MKLTRYRNMPKDESVSRINEEANAAHVMKDSDEEAEGMPNRSHISRTKKNDSRPNIVKLPIDNIDFFLGWAGRNLKLCRHVRDKVTVQCTMYY